MSLVYVGTLELDDIKCHKCHMTHISAGLSLPLCPVDTLMLLTHFTYTVCFVPQINLNLN